MTQRFDFSQSDPKAYQAMLGLETYLHNCGLKPPLLHLIKTRASQINGCAFCIDMHTKEARADGESEQRLYALSAWVETSFFTPAERAVLALTEVVTCISEQAVPDTVYAEVCRHFSDAEVTKILMAIVTINSWNRLAIAAQILPGSYTVAAVA